MAKVERIGVLFVCLGNICRSPLAEGAFRHLVSEQGLEDRFLIDSAGTSSWHVGSPPHEMACEAALSGGFDISGQVARKIKNDDFQNFHYVLAMDKNNLWDLRKIKPEGSRSRLTLLLTFSDLARLEVPDPYYGGVEEFQDCLFLINTGAEGLLEVIRREHLS